MITDVTQSVIAGMILAGVLYTGRWTRTVDHRLDRIERKLRIPNGYKADGE